MAYLVHRAFPSQRATERRKVSRRRPARRRLEVRCSVEREGLATDMVDDGKYTWRGREAKRARRMVKRSRLSGAAVRVHECVRDARKEGVAGSAVVVLIGRS